MQVPTPPPPPDPQQWPVKGKGQRRKLLFDREHRQWHLTNWEPASWSAPAPLADGAVYLYPASAYAVYPKKLALDSRQGLSAEIGMIDGERGSAQRVIVEYGADGWVSCLVHECFGTLA